MHWKETAAEPGGSPANGQKNTNCATHNTEFANLPQHSRVLTAVPLLENWAAKQLLPVECIIDGTYPSRNAALDAAARIAEAVGGRVLR